MFAWMRKGVSVGGWQKETNLVDWILYHLKKCVLMPAGPRQVPHSAAHSGPWLRSCVTYSAWTHTAGYGLWLAGHWEWCLQVEMLQTEVNELRSFRFNYCPFNCNWCKQLLTWEVFSGGTIQPMASELYTTFKDISCVILALSFKAIHILYYFKYFFVYLHCKRIQNRNG